LREELNQSTFSFVIEIDNTSTNWIQDYYYRYEDGKDEILIVDNNWTDFKFAEWEYGEEYIFSIRFLCHSSNDTVRSLPFFEEGLYIHGSFTPRNARADKVRLWIKDWQENDILGSETLVYYGDLGPSGYPDPDYDVLIIVVDTYGQTWMS